MSENGSERPLDTLEGSMGQVVTLRLKSGETYAGELAGYDQHLNVVLTETAAGLDGPPREETAAEWVEGILIIRGDNVVTIGISASD